jgi:hypothetical protein
MIYLNCIKHAPNESIAAVGGTDGINGTQRHYTEGEAIAAINAGTESFVVLDSSGHEANVRVAHHGGRQFLETHRDGVKTDNLGQLPICHHAPSPRTAALSTGASPSWSFGLCDLAVLASLMLTPDYPQFAPVEPPADGLTVSAWAREASAIRG